MTFCRKCNEEIDEVYEEVKRVVDRFAPFRFAADKHRRPILDKLTDMMKAERSAGWVDRDRQIKAEAVANCGHLRDNDAQE